MKNVKYAGDVLCFVFVVKKLYKHIHVISTHTLDHISHIARQSIYFSFLFFAFLSFGESARKISFIHMIIIIILLRPSHDLTRASSTLCTFCAPSLVLLPLVCGKLKVYLSARISQFSCKRIFRVRG